MLECSKMQHFQHKIIPARPQPSEATMPIFVIEDLDATL